MKRSHADADDRHSRPRKNAKKNPLSKEGIPGMFSKETGHGAIFISEKAAYEKFLEYGIFEQYPAKCPKCEKGNFGPRKDQNTHLHTHDSKDKPITQVCETLQESLPKNFFQWRCKSDCKYSLSVRKHSLMEKSHLKVNTMMQIIYFFSCKITITACAAMVGE